MKDGNAKSAENAKAEVIGQQVKSTTADDITLTSAVIAVIDEVRRASAAHPPMNSAHEAYAIILEEVEELWDQVKKKRSERSREDMAKELTQIAAMALRAKVDLNLMEDITAGGAA